MALTFRVLTKMLGHYNTGSKNAKMDKYGKDCLALCAKRLAIPIGKNSVKD